MKEEITKYLRKVVLAQVDKKIDFKSDEFFKISKENFYNGIIDPNITLKLFQNKRKEEKTNQQIDENLYVILAVKVIRTIVEGSQKKDEDLEDLTGIFYVPALLNKKNSCLIPTIEDNKLPWFPRELLKPMIEPELAIGDGTVYDEVVSDEIYNIYTIQEWSEYIKYCKSIYEKTTNCEFDKDIIYNMNGPKQAIPLENNIYIFVDKTINPTYFIKNLYTDILKQEENLPLYDNFISLKENEDEKLIENTLESKKAHLGQMGGKFGLSNSQREGINHFNQMKNGDILAIKGPPGTGKTTLLQSIVASKYVETALKEEIPNLIVAASTNNQAVTNIIQSFGKITPKFNNNLETRWIEKVNSFATYFPSKQKMMSAKARGFQYTDNRGNYFVANVDNEENIKASKEKFLDEAEKLFDTINEKIIRNIRPYKSAIHEKLCRLQYLKNWLIDIVKKLDDLLEGKKFEEMVSNTTNILENIKNTRDSYIDRVEFWNEKYKQIPFVWKIFSFIKTYKVKISNRLKIYKNEKEKFDNDIIDLSTIEEYYALNIKELNGRINELQNKLEKINNYQMKYKNYMKESEKCFVKVDNIKENVMNSEELELWLDTNLRYVSFWLAVHYYEARWIEGENELSPKQKGTNFNNVIKKLYNRLSLITPCLVMTFYMLPREFEASFDGTKGFLYNLIDLLIVDEAGQVSTEIAACSFALAKKAIVVGDEKQIPPVWGIDKPLDKSLAIQEHVIEQEKEFENLEKCGITASDSSVMKVACKSTKYRKFEEKGLFLSEHQRCFDDIIQYCNELVYKGKLKPLRGNSQKGAEELLPKMGYYLIETKKSEKKGTSRINTNEAIGIANWIIKNADNIFKYYKMIKEDINLNNVIGIVTPFKEQAREIKRIFKEMLPQSFREKITIGTIHTFQGGERKIIIMSTTYGSEDGCFFIDNNKSLMNVAVSRAEDSFFVFGDIECLKNEKNSPSGLLKSYIIANKIK